MSKSLQTGDLIWYKNYFCEITHITPHKDGNPDYDALSIVRKFRSDGTPIKKSVWENRISRCWVTHADIHFEMLIYRYQQLLETYYEIII